MPKKPIDYSRTVIYKIVCRDLDVKDCYVGSTTQFTKRKCQHKCACNNVNDKNDIYKVYKFIRDNGGWDNWDMVLIEKYPCNDKNESHSRERYYIEQLKASLNCIIPTRTKKEYREANKETIAQKKKQYREANKETIAQKKKQYREANKEMIARTKKEYYDSNKEMISQKMKQYREANKEIISQKRKQNREANKEMISQKRKQKYTCLCGSILRKNDKARHEKTKKHQAFINC